MDRDSRSILIGGALFLQSEYPVRLFAHHRRQFRWNSPRPHDTFAGLVEAFLDSMSLLLIPPSAESVAACCLDLPLAGRPAHLADQSTPERPAPGDTAPATGTKCSKITTSEGYLDQEPPTLTLRIARNGQLTASEDQQLNDLATKIINFMQTGRRSMPHQTLVKKSNKYIRIGTSANWEPIKQEILLQCRGKIRNCILGNDPRNSRISQFSSVIQQLADSPPPAYIPSLKNLLYAGRSSIYTPQNADEAYARLVGGLRKFAVKTKAVSDGEWSSASMITSAAASMRREEVLMALLQKSLSTRNARKATRFLERLAAYGVALESLRQLFLRRSAGSSHPLFTSKIVILLLPPNHMSFQPPSLDELSSSVMTVDEHESLQIPLTACESYTSISTDVDLEEHCEIQLVHFYIENPDTVPVLPYLGISKPSCFQCSAFFGRLQDPGLPGSPIKFRVRAERAKVCGRWLPPDDIGATGAIRDRVLESLRHVADEIQLSLREVLRRLGYSNRFELGGFCFDDHPMKTQVF